MPFKFLRRRKNRAHSHVEVRRGAYAVDVPVSAMVNDEEGLAIAGAVRQVLAAADGERIHLGLGGVEAMAREAWRHILEVSIECQREGVGVTSSDMRPEVRANLRCVWDEVAQDVERTFRERHAAGVHPFGRVHAGSVR